MMRHLYLVQDDANARPARQAVLGKRCDIMLRPYVSATAFLNALGDVDPGVVLIDLEKSGSDGLDILRHLRSGVARSIGILIVDLGDVQCAVAAMRAGAFDVLERPFDDGALLEAVDAAYRDLDRLVREKVRIEDARRRLATLSGRESKVLNMLSDGLSNKEIGADLAISSRTVEYYRANMMEKLKVRSLAEAIKLALIGQLFDLPRERDTAQ